MLQCMLLWRSIVGLFQLWVQLVLQFFGFLLRAHLVHGCVSMTWSGESHENDLFLPSVPNIPFFFSFPLQVRVLLQIKTIAEMAYSSLPIPNVSQTLSNRGSSAPPDFDSSAPPILWANRAVKRWDGSVGGRRTVLGRFSRFSPRISPGRLFFWMQNRPWNSWGYYWPCILAMYFGHCWYISGYLGYVFRFWCILILLHAIWGGKKCSKCTSSVPRAILQAGSSTAS